jgi:hypothetical protein
MKRPLISVLGEDDPLGLTDVETEFLLITSSISNGTRRVP